MSHNSLQLDRLQIGIIVLGLATAVIHIMLAVPGGLIAFYLNGLGYIGLVGAYFLPAVRRRRRLIRWILIGYTALTIVLWVFVGARNTVAYADKLIELLLILLLWLDDRQFAR